VVIRETPEMPLTNKKEKVDVTQDIPHLDAEIVSPIDVHIQHEMVKESLEDAVLAKESSQPQSSYEAAATLIELEECYEELKKSYDLDKTIFSTYHKVYLLKRSRKDKDEDPSAGSDRGLKKKKTSKDTEPKKEFKIADSNMPHDQEENPGNDDEEPKEKVASKRDWFTKPTQPQEPTDPDWNAGKTPQQGKNQNWLMTLASSAEKPSKTFDELMSDVRIKKL
nr:hypothetical protein [Tanacetum cinerariifolium]